MRFIAIIFLVISLASASAANFYVDNSGSDANTGLSGSPWQHVGYALSNAPAGASVYLTSGQKFSQDNILFTHNNILLAASGSTPATIANITGTNVLLGINVDNITISNLNLYGSGRAMSNTWACVNFDALITSYYGHCTNISIFDCEVTNASYGIYFFDQSSVQCFNGLQIIGCRVHAVEEVGINIQPNVIGWNGVTMVSNAVTAFNEVYDVTGDPAGNSGSGIVLFNVSHWECYSNYVHDCGYKQGNSGGGGAGGILPVFYSDHVHIWKNTVASIWSMPNGGDGVGIDLDADTSQSIVEGNFVHDCGGAGYYSFLAAGNNIFRWNVGINDGSNGVGEIWFNDYSHSPTGSVDYVYNNTFIGNKSAMTITDPLIGPTALMLNNIFGQFNTNGILISSYYSIYTNWQFAGNEYMPPNFWLTWAGGTSNYFNLAQWQTLAGQEIGTGFTNNPSFAVGSGTIASNYLLQAASQLVRAGIDVRQYGLSPGTMDYLGHTPLNSDNNLGGLVGTAGTGTFYYLTVNSGSGSGNYSNGVTAPLSASAISGYNFINWSGPNITNPNLASTTVTVYSNTAVTANYAQALGGSSLNVADYGANGNAVALFVNTVSNSTILTTISQLSGADVGKVIELFGAGPLGTSTNHQDLVAVITGVVNATNIYLDRICGATTNNCYAIYGINNAGAFQACIDAAPSNSVINIPNGTYLIIGPQALDANFISSGPYATYPSIVISKGGLTLLGQSRDNTILLGCGAWQNKGSWTYRGYMFACQGPVTNNGPLIFDTLTMDGGVQQGFTGVTGFPANPATGDGWDVTHDAVIDVGLPPLHNAKIFRNCTITRWRGEQFKSVTSGWDGFISITNCSFGNGDGSAINFNFTHNIDNCQFSNLFEVMEFYQAYCSNTCYLQNCTVTNTQALIAINGALSNSVNPLYIVRNNTFCLGPGNGIQTTPAQNLMVSNNLFFGGLFPITIGVQGYQGSAMNSNILVVCNIFSNNWTPIEIEGSGANSLVNMLVSNNVAYGTYSHLFAESESGGWGTNMVFVNNFITNFSEGLVGSGLSGQYFIDSDSNIFPPHQIYAVGGTNEIGYEFGQRHTIQAAQSTSVFYTDNNHSNQIPAGAKLGITNLTSWTVPVYLSARLSGSPVVLSQNQSFTAYWTGTSWTTNAGGGNSGPASIQVTPGNVPFGTLLSGTSWTNSLMVQNIGGSVLNGTASAVAPYIILSGGTYSLGANQSQAIVVAFNPTGAGSFNQNLNFTGGGGMSVALSGTATNLPAVGSIIQMSPGSANYGIVSTGTSATQIFQVQNVGSGTLTGSASVAMPFNIVSGGTYSLKANQSQTVTVTFNPSAAGPYNLNVAFSGGGGTNATVIGRAFSSNAALRPPTNLTNQPAGTLTNGQ
jgi:hypothetical protein